MKTKQEILSGLNQFTGTERYYLCGIVKLTDGVKWLCESADCYWLVDVIASYQGNKVIRNDEMLQGIQFWKFVKCLDGSGWVLCERDTDDVVIRQHVPATDFPLDEIKLYYSPVDRVLLLPGEY